MDTQAPNKTQTKETFERKINDLMPVRRTNVGVKCKIYFYYFVTSVM